MKKKAAKSAVAISANTNYQLKEIARMRADRNCLVKDSVSITAELVDKEHKREVKKFNGDY